MRGKTCEKKKASFAFLFNFDTNESDKKLF